jgi:acetoin utilization protein AcuB
MESVSPNDSVLTLSESLVGNNIRALPVVETGAVGLATQMDVVSAMADATDLSEHPARELLMSPVWSIDIDKGIAHARRIMLERWVSHVPVMEQGRLVGIVTAGDIVHTFTAPSSKTTKGERVGSRTRRLPGQIIEIMDSRPCAL